MLLKAELIKLMEDLPDDAPIILGLSGSVHQPAFYVQQATYFFTANDEGENVPVKCIEIGCASACCVF